MGTRGYIVHRFRGRYYVRYNHYDSYYEGLGAAVAASIPNGKDAYQKWLEAARAYYAAREKKENETKFVIGYKAKIESDSDENSDDYCESGSENDIEVKYDATYKFDGEEWPTVALLEPEDLFIEYCYIINLDAEVLTMNYGIHWDLRNVPQENNQWIKSICDSIHHFNITIDPDICGPEYMGCPAVPLRDFEWSQFNNGEVVTPRSTLNSAAHVFLSHCAAKIFSNYNVEMTRFAREWNVDSFTLREFVFAFISIASGQVNLIDLHKTVCNEDICACYWCTCQRQLRASAWLDESVVGELAPLPVFGSLYHLPNSPAGASPTAITYWHRGVVVHISLVVDGKAINDGVEWGVVEQGRNNFQLCCHVGF